MVIVIQNEIFQMAHLKRVLNFDNRGFRFAFRRAFRVSSSRERAVTAKGSAVQIFHSLRSHDPRYPFEGTGTRPDYLSDRADKKIEGRKLERKDKEIEKQLMGERWGCRHRGHESESGH